MIKKNFNNVYFPQLKSWFYNKHTAGYIGTQKVRQGDHTTFRKLQGLWNIHLILLFTFGPPMRKEKQQISQEAPSFWHDYFIQ